MTYVRTRNTISCKLRAKQILGMHRQRIHKETNKKREEKNANTNATAESLGWAGAHFLSGLGLCFVHFLVVVLYARARVCVYLTALSAATSIGDPI